LTQVVPCTPALLKLLSLANKQTYHQVLSTEISGTYLEKLFNCLVVS